MAYKAGPHFPHCCNIDVTDHTSSWKARIRLPNMQNQIAELLCRIWQPWISSWAATFTRVMWGEGERQIDRKTEKERERETWVNDLACLTAVLLAGRSGTNNIDFQLSAAHPMYIYTHTSSPGHNLAQRSGSILGQKRPFPFFAQTCILTCPHSTMNEPWLSSIDRCHNTNIEI